MKKLHTKRFFPEASLRKPKFWDSQFAAHVIDDFHSGKLTLDNIEEWDKKINGGKKPIPPFNTKEIIDYHLQTKKDPRKP